MDQVLYYKSKKLFKVVGVLWIIIGVLWLIENGLENWIGYGYLLFGFAWLTQNGKRKAISFKNNQLILHNQEDLFNKKIPMDQIRSIENRYIIIRINLLNGKEHDIDKDSLKEGDVEKLDSIIEDLKLHQSA